MTAYLHGLIPVIVKQSEKFDHTKRGVLIDPDLGKYMTIGHMIKELERNGR